MILFPVLLIVIFGIGYLRIVFVPACGLLLTLFIRNSRAQPKTHVNPTGINAS